MLLDWKRVHCKPIPVMKTGISLCTFPKRENPVFITWEPCNENRFFPVWEKYTGKSLYWPCTGPVRDCSVCNNVSRYVLSNLLSFIKLSYTFVVYLMWYRSVGWPTWVPWKNVFLLWYGLTIIHLGIHTASFYQLLTKKKCSSIDYRDKRTLFEYKK